MSFEKGTRKSPHITRINCVGARATGITVKKHFTYMRSQQKVLISGILHQEKSVFACNLHACCGGRRLVVFVSVRCSPAPPCPPHTHHRVLPTAESLSKSPTPACAHAGRRAAPCNDRRDQNSSKHRESLSSSTPTTTTAGATTTSSFTTPRCRSSAPPPTALAPPPSAASAPSPRKAATA